MRRLATAFAGLALSSEEAVHGRDGAEVAALIQQVGVDAGWRLVHEALMVQHAEHLDAFGTAESAWLRRPHSTWPRRSRARAVAAIVRCSRSTHRGTRGSCPDHYSQVADHLVGHHFGSPPPVSAPPVASCSSSAESFPCTSITRRAFPRSDCKRAFSRRSRVSSCSRESLGGRPGEAANAWRAPWSRCLRHSEINDEYSPSRRRRAPLSSRPRRSYSARIRSLYCAL